jgi:hypothetical protein
MMITAPGWPAKLTTDTDQQFGFFLLPQETPMKRSSPSAGWLPVFHPQNHAAH